MTPRPRLLRTVLTRLAAVLLGLLLAFLMVELLLRLAYGSLPMGLQIALRDVRVTPFTDTRLAPPPLWQADTAFQTIVRPGAVNLLQAGSPTVTFNVSSYGWWGGRVGFRSEPPHDGYVESVVLGDSFTFCFTEVDSCWVSVARRATGLRLYNLGQPVTGSVSHAKLYYEFVAKPELKLRQPKLVIWQFYGNDFNDDYGLARLNGSAQTPSPVVVDPLPPPNNGPLAWLRENSALYMLTSRLLRGKDPGIEKFIDPHHVQKDKLDLWFGQSYIRDAFDVTQPRNQEGERLSQQAILQTRELVERDGGRFLIVLMPTKEETYQAIAAPLMGQAAIDALAAPRQRLLEFCKAQHLTCLDMLPTLQAAANTGQQIYLSADPHLNVEGNEVVGKAVAAFLQDQKWIPLGQ